ncbi:MAG: pyridoxal phosphate-dependent aminotransferase [Acidimicrobiia bacterium]
MARLRYKHQPTTAEIAQRFGLRENDVVRFDHNTSPYATDWAPGVVGPMARHLNEYPSASYSALREAAAAYLGTDVAGIVPGAGIDEIILVIARAFLGEGTRACTVVPTYPLYEIASLQTGSEFIAVPAEPPSFGWPARAIGEAAETSDVTWLCTPNNPSGNNIPNAELAAILGAARGVVVVDAAYAEFAGDVWAPWVEKHENLIVCHTMSKAFGLAALRVGFAMTSPRLAEVLDAVRPPGSISSMSAQLAEVSLSEPQRMRRRVARLERERGRITERLQTFGFGVMPSHANFVLCEAGERSPAIAEALVRQGMVVRSYPATGPLGHFLRITVRSPEENDRLLVALDRITASGV